MPEAHSEHLLSETRLAGVVTWFDWRKGFGFIQPDSQQPVGEDDEIFVSYEDIERDGFKTLETGERVTFVLKPVEGGRKAARVSPLVEELGGE